MNCRTVCHCGADHTQLQSTCILEIKNSALNYNAVIDFVSTSKILNIRCHASHALLLLSVKKYLCVLDHTHTHRYDTKLTSQFKNKR